MTFYSWSVYNKHSLFIFYHNKYACPAYLPSLPTQYQRRRYKSSCIDIIDKSGGDNCQFTTRSLWSWQLSGSSVFIQSYCRRVARCHWTCEHKDLEPHSIKSTASQPDSPCACKHRDSEPHSNESTTTQPDSYCACELISILTRQHCIYQ